MLGLGDLQDLVESLPAVIRADGILLLIADVGVCGDEDLDRVGVIFADAWSGRWSVCYAMQANAGRAAGTGPTWCSRHVGQFLLRERSIADRRE